MPSPSAPPDTADAADTAPHEARDATAEAALASPAAAPRRWSSKTLFGAAREVEIEHDGQLYRLRQTSLGKLILTK